MALIYEGVIILGFVWFAVFFGDWCRWWSEAGDENK